MTTVLIEGIGDIVSKPTGYGRAVRKLIIDKEHKSDDRPRVIFADVCEEWHKSQDGDLVKTREQTRNKLIEWGAEFIDKSVGNPTERQKYDDLLKQSVDAVFVATPDRYHMDIAKHWLTGNCKRVFIEKPLSNDPRAARKWIGELENHDRDRERLIQLDHYLLKVHSHFKYSDPDKPGFDPRASGNQTQSKLEQLKGLRFYMLEDHSGADKEYCRTTGRQQRRGLNGPIEIENRIEALQDGISLDLLPHLLALLIYFGKPHTFKITELCPAKYAGVNYDDSEYAGINGETFAAIKFTFTNHNNQKTFGEAYIGKGIRGSSKYPWMKGNVKVLELEGVFGHRVEFDFNSSVVSSIDKLSNHPPVYAEPVPIVDLESDPYYYLLRNVVLKRMRGADLGIPISTGSFILDTIVSQITSRTKKAQLQTYKLGSKSGGRLPPMLEDLLPGGSNVIKPLR